MTIENIVIDKIRAVIANVFLDGSVIFSRGLLWARTPEIQTPLHVYLFCALFVLHRTIKQTARKDV